MFPFSTVLIADPDPQARSLYVSLLTGRARQIECADNGCDALLKAQQHQPDLIIADTCLPRLNGFDLCTLVRNWRKPPACILVTSGAGEWIEDRACAAGADVVIEKPLVADRVIAALDVLEELLQSSAA